MSLKEVDRANCLEKVKFRQISLKEASSFLRLSYPQIKRLWSKYKKQGCLGLISRKRTQKSNRAVPQKKRDEIASIISREYQHCAPLFVKEKLKEHYGINYSAEFIRKLMIEYKLWIPHVRRIQKHQRRIRRACEGEMGQIDASLHDWFEGRGPKCYLHLIIDDATSKLMGGHFASEETTEGYFRACFSYFETNGRPISLYSDKRGTFVVNKGSSVKGTQFARAMKELGIQMITAHSPQAKGRIERAFGTLQERLVWEMRLHHISTIEEANVFLPHFLEEHNTKFAKHPSNPLNVHRPLFHMELKYILCKKEVRKVSKNFEISFNGEIFQLQPSQKIANSIKNANIMVLTTLENEILLQYNNEFIDYVTYNEQEFQLKAVRAEDTLSIWKTRKPYIPSKFHPYKQIRVQRQEKPFSPQQKRTYSIGGSAPMPPASDEIKQKLYKKCVS